MVVGGATALLHLPLKSKWQSMPSFHPTYPPYQLERFSPYGGQDLRPARYFPFISSLSGSWHLSTESVRHTLG